MFFEGRDASNEEETLLILSVETRSRKQAELKIMSAIESKLKGFIINGSERERFETDLEPLGLNIFSMNESEFTYALGRGGNTRRKLERASGAIMEYIGTNAFIAGTRQQRNQAVSYLQMLLDQREGRVSEFDENRPDLTIIDIPRDFADEIGSSRGRYLRNMEEMTDTFCFTQTVLTEGGDRVNRLYIFGNSRSERSTAQRKFERYIDDLFEDKHRSRRRRDRSRSSSKRRYSRSNSPEYNRRPRALR